jgi:antitoxin (DNA-binding transcriptional repressor) of toxin-antitoxin stability system
VQKGQPIVLTRRGKPVVRLEPIREEVVSSDDPFFSLANLHVGTGASLSNAQIDSVIYGE